METQQHCPAIYVAYEDCSLSAVLQGDWKDCLKLLQYGVSSYKASLSEHNKAAADELSNLISSATYSTAPNVPVMKELDFNDDYYAKLSIDQDGLVFEFESCGPAHEYRIVPLERLDSVKDVLTKREQAK